MTKSATGTEYVNAQLLDLRELIDKYAGMIRNVRPPDYIQVIVPPTKLAYSEGEQIDLSGIVVKAFYQDGTEWGIVPRRALGKSPQNATTHGGTSARSDLFNDPVYFTYETAWVRDDGWWGTVEYTPPANGIVELSGYWNGTFSGCYGLREWDGGGGIGYAQYVHNGKSVYYADFHTIGLYPLETHPQVNNSFNYGAIVWTAFYGEVSNKVTISWARPIDGEILTATFDITVVYEE